MSNTTTKDVGNFIDEMKTPICMFNQDMVQIDEFESLKRAIQVVFGGVRTKQNIIADMCKHRRPDTFITHPKLNIQVTFRYKTK